MKFLSRFLGWALLFGLPAWAFGDRYRELLAGAVEVVLAAFGERVELERIDAIAPMDLALFAALTLASDAWSTRRRAQALVAGAGALVVAEIAMWSLYLAGLMSAAARGADTGTAGQMARTGLGAAAWLAAITAWLLGPGAAVLERAAGPIPRSRPAKRQG